MIQAAPVDLAALPPSLRAKAELIVDGMSAIKNDHSATDFGEGQISGPFGPRFVGFGPRPTLAERWGATVALAAAIALTSALVMLAG